MKCLQKNINLLPQTHNIFVDENSLKTKINHF